MLTDRIRESISREKVTELSAFSGFQGRIKSMIQEEINKFKDQIIEELQRLMHEKIGEEGINTMKGDRGYTPQRGIDYFTPEELSQIKEEVTPKKGVHYFDGSPGANGSSPSSKEISRLLAIELKKLKPQDWNADKFANLIARALEKLQGEERLDYEALKNRPIAEITSKRKFGGRGGGGGINELTATGAVNSVNTIYRFDFEPKYIVSDGIKYKKGGGWTWSYPNATMTIPPTFSIWGEE